MKRKFLLLLYIIFTLSIYSQTDKKENPTTFEKKQLQAKLISKKISIDGILDETEWENAAIANDFVMLEPDNGKKLDPNKNTEVKVLFDNEAIYIGAILNDNEPTKIMREITQRDDTGSSDFFGLSVNGYNDGQQEFRFFVTAAGVQLDANANSLNGEDFSWNAIWDSHATITDKGWVVEIKLPYSALRFPQKPSQLWGIQFFRQIRRDRQLYTWNYVDNKKGALEQQSGELVGVENIKTPTRLFLFPYASTYVSNNKEDGTKTQLKGGLDIKYGINDAFTLDAILVPDFGQTAFDDQILNLGPFEQQFNENRPFFTEGTELFNKGNLFYSRRIGGSPSLGESDLNLNENEIVTNSPSKVNLLNALKISGRTQKGLGIGVLNAVTEKTEATITDQSTGTTRKEILEPLANYNITVFDQRFNKNSSVSFINTNVTRDGQFQDANVSGIVYDLNNKKNTWNLGGDVKYSYVNPYGDIKNKQGVNTSLYFGETAGKIRFFVNANYISKDFDNNDLGINFTTNLYSIYGNVNYRLLKPTELFNSLRVNFNAYHEFQNTTGKYQGGNFNMNVNGSTKSNDGFGAGLSLRPFVAYDFYSPLVDEKYIAIPENINFWFYISSNYNRKFAIDFNPNINFSKEVNRYSYGFDLSPRYRFNNKLLMVLGYNYSLQNHEVNHFDNFDKDIIFAKRNINTSTLSLRSKYAINNKMTINLTTRYYWRYYENIKFLKLQDDGSVINYSYTDPANRSFSSWNFDCSYSWWIAPGSQLNVLYRNNSISSLKNLETVNENFATNVDSLFGDKLSHSFSISLRYFLDYNKIKNWL
jgi:Domain of unknown function (DUF5916)/Carbohydrate family 9 binding domain-like